MGKGGGGSAPQPTSQTVNQTNLPEYARPYFEDIMTRGTTASNVAYQPYQGQRVADFSPLQQQGFQGVQDLGVSPLMQPATGLTGAAGIGGLGAGQQYTQQATSPGAMQSYMSPYMQNVVDWQKTQAVSDYGRQLPGQQAAAARAGAFGGSRQAIVESEAQRNLQNQLAGIQATGTQNAYEQANKNLQFGSQLGLQGLGLAGQMGQQFGQLGQTAFGQQAAAAQAQQSAGAVQQAQQQDLLNKRYEEFMQQKYYPQEQLQFLSSLLRGSVVAPQQTMYQYQAAPSMVSQLGGLGMGALGLSNAFRARGGGEVPGYAEGGITGGAEGQPTTLEVSKIKTALLKGADPRSMPPSIALLLAVSDPRVKEAIAMRQGAKTQMALDQGRQQPQRTVLDDEMAGLAGLDVPEETFAAASGGIVAFEEGGVPRGARPFDITDPFGLMSGLRYMREEFQTPKTEAEAARIKRLQALADEDARNREGVRGAPMVAPAGLPAALPAAGDQLQGRPATQPSDFARPVAAKPDLSQQIPPARPAATAAPAVKTAPEKAEEGVGMIPMQDVAKKEQEYRDYMGKKYSSELQDRLAELKEQGAQALKERDADRWLAVAMGGFAAAAGSSPYALKNFAEGLGLTTKEIATVNKDFRKANDALKKAEREERKADRLEQMGMDDKAYQVRQNAEKFNLDAQKANQSFKANIEQTKAYRDVAAMRMRETQALAGERAEDRKFLQQQKLDADKEGKLLRARQEVEKSKPLVDLGMRINDVQSRLASAKGDKATKLNTELEALYTQYERMYGDTLKRVMGGTESVGSGWGKASVVGG